MRTDPPAEDTAPAVITDHPFNPRRQWWSRCVDCGLAGAAHATSCVSPPLQQILADGTKRAA